MRVALAAAAQANTPTQRTEMLATWSNRPHIQAEYDALKNPMLPYGYAHHGDGVALHRLELPDSLTTVLFPNHLLGFQDVDEQFDSPGCILRHHLQGTPQAY